APLINASSDYLHRGEYNRVVGNGGVNNDTTLVLTRHAESGTVVYLIKPATNWVYCTVTPRAK
ncbi:hypothetical protein, partial [Enterobacter sichuanensis]